MNPDAGGGAALTADAPPRTPDGQPVFAEGTRTGVDERSQTRSNPIGSNPIGSNPIGSNPIGSNPIGSNPIGSNPIAQPGLSDGDLAEVDRRFETASAPDIIRWAVDAFHPHLCLTSSMTDAVLIDLAVRVEPSIEVVFIDTGYHFPETLDTLDRVRRRYGLNLRMMTVAPQLTEFWKVDPVNCCSAEKVAQLERALAGKLAWMSGLRRVDSPTRADARVVALDGRGLVKINPIATWDDAAVARYVAEHDVPVNPLLERGYRSIGCAPCTRPVAEGEEPRAGRWAGTAKTECGLHLDGDAGRQPSSGARARTG